ncbi:sugar MFS transporter [Seongchinamella unica]|uniref:Sugar MFS transporter n=1 Tax=Seongchinamella unica TaxID=2547392 RepID=A0A4R5LTN3_9GAMM|nr:sugar MFS transporter [Seongchinamella unica]TDG14682.1 sugar MFS transporter [Seongchinamella unica]
MAGQHVSTNDMAAGNQAQGNTTNGVDQDTPGKYLPALTALTMLFFTWGFITCLNDILIPHLKAVFDLNYTEAMLIQFCFFGAYFLISLPAGALVKRIGYGRGVVIGLLVASLGALLFYPAASYLRYPLFLGALFVLASGITVLQVSANPYVAALGSPHTASSRLNMTQAFNSLGTTVAPFIGAVLILSVSTTGLDAEAGKQAQADAVKLPYILLASILAVMAIMFSQLKLPVIHSHHATQQTPTENGSIWSQTHLVLGALGIFLYVGAEVAIGSFLVNFLAQENIAAMEESQAAHYIAYYWGGAMVGRFIGAVVMRYVKPGRLLCCNALCAVILVTTAMLGSGSLAMWAILLVGLCNSIMFPTIFSLAIAQLGTHTSQGSGIVCLAIVGGAIVPLVQGVAADSLGLQQAFIIPLLCYIYIAYYGLRGSIPAKSVCMANQ